MNLVKDFRLSNYNENAKTFVTFFTSDLSIPPIIARFILMEYIIYFLIFIFQLIFYQRSCNLLQHYGDANSLSGLYYELQRLGSIVKLIFIIFWFLF